MRYSILCTFQEYIPVEKELEQCTLEYNEENAILAPQIQALTNEWKQLKTEFEELQLHSLNQSKEWESQFSEVNSQVVQIRRRILTTRNTLSTTFNCKAKVGAVRECFYFCRFPHAYDNCKDPPERESYFEIYSWKKAKTTIQFNYVQNATNCEFRIVLDSPEINLI